MNNQIEFSIVAPCYNEERCLEEFVSRVMSMMESYNKKFEILLINDGSADNTLEVSKGLAKTYNQIKIIDFSRNFGHQAAVTAGLDYSKGNAVIIIDSDLQDPPEVISEMIKKWKEGFQVVYGKRTIRKGESFMKLFTAKIFYKVLQKLTSTDIPVDTGDFRLIDKKVVTIMKSMREKHRFIRGMVSWTGFKQTPVYYERDSRFSGETGYPLRKMLTFALDGITSFSIIPLQFLTLIGIIVTTITVLLSLLVFFVKLFIPEFFLAGFPTIILVVMFFGGIQVFFLGIMGEYIGRIFNEVKNRPNYIVENVYQSHGEQIIPI